MAAVLFSLFLLVLAGAAGGQAGLYTLPEFGGKTFAAREGEIVETKSGRKLSRTQLAAALRHADYVVIGESHDNPAHHQLQADVIRGLVEAGRRVAVGMEMMERPMQPVATAWGRGELSEDEFIDRSQWYTRWGFHFSLYKPIFDVVKEKRLRLAALNAPRALVSRVGRNGPSALSAGELAEAGGPLYLQNKRHRLLFETMIGGSHGPRMDSIYAAQVLWDEYMAQSAMRERQAAGRAVDVMVVIAGNGHVFYGQGINYRLERRNAGRVVSIVSIEAENGRQTFSSSLADYVFVSPPAKQEWPAFGAGLEKGPEGRLRARSNANSKSVALPLQRGDLIVSIDGRSFSEPHQALAYVAKKRFGDRLVFVLERNGERMTLEHTIELRS